MSNTVQANIEVNVKTNAEEALSNISNQFDKVADSISNSMNTSLKEADNLISNINNNLGQGITLDNINKLAGDIDSLNTELLELYNNESLLSGDAISEYSNQLIGQIEAVKATFSNTEDVQNFMGQINDSFEMLDTIVSDSLVQGVAEENEAFNSLSQTLTDTTNSLNQVGQAISDVGNTASQETEQLDAMQIALNNIKAMQASGIIEQPEISEEYIKAEEALNRLNEALIDYQINGKGVNDIKDAYKETFNTLNTTDMFKLSDEDRANLMSQFDSLREEIKASGIELPVRIDTSSIEIAKQEVRTFDEEILKMIENGEATMSKLMAGSSFNTQSPEEIEQLRQEEEQRKALVDEINKEYDALVNLNTILKSHQNLLDLNSNISGAFDSSTLQGLSQSLTPVANNISNVGNSAQDASKNLNDLNKETGNTGKEIESLSKELGGGLSTSLSVIATGINQAIELFEKLTDVIKDCTEAGTDFENAYTVLFNYLGTEAGAEIKAWTNELEKLYGFDATGVVQEFDGFAQALASIGVYGEDAAEVGKKLTLLAKDIEAFNRGSYSIEEVDRALQSFIKTGNTRTLTNMGIFNKQEADKIKNLSNEVERLNYLFSKGEMVNGAYLNQMDTASGSIETLSQRFKALTGNIGQLVTGLYAQIAPLLINLVTLINNAVVGLAKLLNVDLSKSNEGAEGLGDYASELDNIAESADKASRKVSSFDDVIQISDSANSDTSSIGDIGDLTDYNWSIEEAKDEVEKLNSEVNTLLENLNKGWENALNAGDVDKAVAKIKKSLSSIKTTLKDIFNNPEMKANILAMGEQWASTLGSVAGSIAVTGVNIAAGLTGGIDKWLSENADYISIKLNNICNDITQLGSNIEDTSLLWANFSTVFSSDEFSNMISSLLNVPASLYLEAYDLGYSIVNSIWGGFNTIWEENQPKLKETATDTFGVIGDIANTVGEKIQDLGTTFNSFFDETVVPKINTVAESVSNTFGVFLDSYNEFLIPVLDGISEKFSTLYAEHIKPFVEKFLNAWDKISTEVISFYQKVLAPVINTIITVAVPMIAGAIDGIVDLVIGLVGSILDTLGGLLDFITGVFTGDWELAWNGILDVLKGILNTLIGAVEGALNIVVDIINGLVKGVNKIEVAGFSAKIPEMEKMQFPRLATGGIVDRATLALIGEAGKEAVVPLENTSWMEELANKIVGIMSNGNNSNNSITLDMSGYAKNFYTRNEMIEFAKLIVEALKLYGVNVSAVY